jgi:hypothetical protein
LVLVGFINHQEVNEEEKYSHTKEGDELHKEDQPKDGVSHSVPN